MLTDAGALARCLAAGADELARISTADLEAAWQGAIAALRDPASPVRRALDGPLAARARLSPSGLAVALETVLAGVAGKEATALFARAAALGPAAERRPVLVVLPGNVPGIAVQPLLPALARRRPVLLKSPSSEPLFAPALVDELLRREPRLAPALAAATWPGGERRIEDEVLATTGTVVAYGAEETLADLAARVGDRLVAFGPRLSLAAIGRDVDPATVAPGLARDVALFDQRGCLSIHAVYTAGDPASLAAAVADALERLALELPAAEPDAATAAAVRGVRDEAAVRGLFAPTLAFRAGTVVVEPRQALVPSPGLRTVRIHPLPELAALPGLLAPWAGSLQGVAVAGRDAEALAPALRRLGVSRLGPPGALQNAPADWANGGIDLLVALG